MTKKPLIKFYRIRFMRSIYGPYIHLWTIESVRRNQGRFSILQIRSHKTSLWVIDSFMTRGLGLVQYGSNFNTFDSQSRTTSMGLFCLLRPVDTLRTIPRHLTKTSNFGTQPMNLCYEPQFNAQLVLSLRSPCSETWIFHQALTPYEPDL